MWACFLLTIAAIQLALGPKLKLSQWRIQGATNACVAEGEAWLNGRLDLAQEHPDMVHRRLRDTALVGDKVYNIFPPLQGFITVALAPMHRLLDIPTDVWLRLAHTLLVFWPVPIVAFGVFRQQTRDSAWAGLLTLSYMGGTALLPNLYFAGSGNVAHTNHVLSQVGLLLLAADGLGRQRIWPSLIGLAICAWSRQLTILYAFLLLGVAWKQKRLALCIAGLVVIVAPLLTLNQLKFGNPLDFGYRYIYEGRENDELAQRCREYGIFSPHFIPENAYYLFVDPPRFEVEPWATSVKFVETNHMGTSLWITSPMLLYVFLAAPGWLRNGHRRWLMLSTLPVLFALLCYHNTGFVQDGYNRFALDFIPIWFVAIAGFTSGGRGNWRTWLTLACTAWSLLYFQAVVPNA